MAHSFTGAIKLADQLGIDIERVGRGTIEAYRVYLRGLAIEADG